MAIEDTHRLGYERVDDDPNVAVLLATMDATGRWAATRQLRAWERTTLRRGRGQRLLDIGCGLGDAALAFAPGLGSHGEVVGVDAAAAMAVVARTRSSGTACRTRSAFG